MTQEKIEQYGSLKERNNFDLLELVCELHFRSIAYGHKETHDRYIEAREELESRLKGYNAALQSQQHEGKWTDDDMRKYLKSLTPSPQSSHPAQQEVGEKEALARKSLKCLLIEVAEPVANDIQKNVLAAFDEIRNQKMQGSQVDWDGLEKAFSAGQNSKSDSPFLFGKRFKTFQDYKSQLSPEQTK